MWQGKRKKTVQQARSGSTILTPLRRPRQPTRGPQWHRRWSPAGAPLMAAAASPFPVPPPGSVQRQGPRYAETPGSFLPARCADVLLTAERNTTSRLRHRSSGSSSIPGGCGGCGVQPGDPGHPTRLGPRCDGPQTAQHRRHFEVVETGLSPRAAVGVIRPAGGSSRTPGLGRQSSRARRGVEPKIRGVRAPLPGGTVAGQAPLSVRALWQLGPLR